MGERNPCREVGCPVSCCHDVPGVKYEGEKEAVFRAFPEAKKFQDSRDFMNEGVYYEISEDGNSIKISGYCPRLDDDLSCTIYDSGDRPSGCQNMKFADYECELWRRVDGLPPVK